MKETAIYGHKMKLQALEDEEAGGAVVADVMVLTRLQRFDDEGELVEWVHIELSKNMSPLIAAAMTEEAHYITRRGFES